MQQRDGLSSQAIGLCASLSALLVACTDGSICVLLQPGEITSAVPLVAGFQYAASALPLLPEELRCEWVGLAGCAGSTRLFAATVLPLAQIKLQGTFNQTTLHCLSEVGNNDNAWAIIPALAGATLY